MPTSEQELIEFLASHEGNGIMEDGKGDEDGNDQ